MKIQPLFDKVVIQPQAKEAKTESGIYIPETTSADRPQQGSVVAVGPKVESVKVGDSVLFTKYGPTEVTVEGTEYLVVKEEDILATL